MTPTASVVDWVRPEVDSQWDWALPLYQEFHRHPEVSFAEHWTTTRIAQEVRELGLEPVAIGETGLGVVLQNGEGPVVMGRADIDALPVTEDTGVDYASEIDGAMHACGHDNHIVGMLGTLKLLTSHKDRWRGTFVAVFQPAEEVGTGAKSMVDAGLTDKLPTPDVVLGQHILPGADGVVGTRVGPILSQADSVKVTLYGRGAHASSPHASKDPVVLAAAVIMRLQTLVSREVSPFETSVLTVASVHAGTGSNIIPDSAELQLNLRNYNSDVRDHVIAALERVVRAEVAASGIDREPTFEYFNQFPLTNNDPETTERTTAALQAFFGEKYQEAPQSPASEDFSDIANAYGAPYCYWFVFADVVKPGPTAINHSPTFAPVPHSSLPTMTMAMSVAALEWLESAG